MNDKASGVSQKQALTPYYFACFPMDVLKYGQAGQSGLLLGRKKIKRVNV
jgi:hypothetical protein